MKKLRKFLTVSVMVLSIIAMSGLVVAPSAKAAASTGDLIKMAGNTSVYYLAADGKRYVFPNSTTYFSWYSDFSGVVTIPAAELQSYPLGGNVTMRPGTKLVKITTDPKVYAVEPNGTLRAIQTEAQAAALYGTNWNKKIVDVPDAFFTNYTIGSVLPSGQYAIGSLIKNNGASEVFYYDGTSYRKIASEAAFYGNRFNFDNVLTASTAVAGTGVTLTGAESALINVSQNGSAVVITGSGLMVSLSASTPAAISVPNNGARVPMAKVNLTAANDGAVSVSSITVKRIGLSSYDQISKVWAEKDGVIVASKKSMNSNDESILTFSPALVVAAGQTVSLDLIVTLTSAAGNIGLSIASASAVSATSAAVSGSFPINSNLMSPTSYSVVNVAISDSNTTASNVKVGDEKVELGHFTLGLSAPAKDISIKSIMLKNNGVEDLSTAAMNLYLENAGNKVSVNTVVDGRFVTFYFTSAGLDLLKDDSSKIFYIKGDVIAKENTATNSFAFVLNKSTDLVAYEKSTGFGANVNYNGTAADAYAISNITIDSGVVSVSKKSTSPSATTIVKGSDNVMLLANIRVDEAITADGLTIKYDSTQFATTTDQFENIRVYLNGVLLDSFDTANSGTASSGTAVMTKTIDSTLTLAKGNNELKVMAKAKTTATNGAIKFVLDGDFLDSQNPEYVVSGNAVSTSNSDISGTATGGLFTVSGATLTTVKSDGYSDGKIIVAGSSDVSLGKFTLKASNDDIKVTSISFGANASTTPTSHTNINDFKLFVDGAQVGNAVDFGSSGANFSSLNFTIAKDSTKAVEVKGSFDSSATGGFLSPMTVNAQDSRGTAVTTGNKATTTIFALSTTGELNIELAGNSPAAAILVSKSTVEQEVAQFKLTAINDSADVTEISVANWDGSAVTSTADARIAAIKLYDGAILIDQFVPVDGAGKFTITNGKVLIPANGNKTLSVKVVLNNIDNDANATDKNILIRLVTAKSKSSAGSETTATDQGINANSFRIRKTVPTVALATLPATLLTSGDVVVSKFTVTADSNGDVALRKIVLKYASSTNVGLATIDNNAVKIDGATKDASSTVDTTAKTITVDFGDSSYVVVSAGTTKTFEILSTVSIGGAGTSTESLTTKIEEDTGYVTNGTGNFVWSDGASISSYTWSNGRRVPGLTTTTQVLSK